MDPIISLLNEIIKKNLPAINSKIQEGIRQRHLDPMHHVASGDEGLGHINLGICTAFAKAGYHVKDLTGLSSLSISSLVIVNGGTNPDNPEEVCGKVQFEAKLGSSINASVGGKVTAGCGFIHPSIGISGKVSASDVVTTAKGSFNADINGAKICLSQINLSQLSVNYGNTSVSIDGLGIFNTFLKPLEDFILNIFKGQIRSAIASALTPVINTEVEKLLPLCGDLP
ncbi:hypothetical protein MNBD_GAMMA09-3626 [hydrothermal vent metagenome]|uniref:Uncharacterized protein n=1 Tax=hydrothermal vent metagenome TaxID=652676 RepID=A0A3B0YQB0_9ZZZZ